MNEDEKDLRDWILLSDAVNVVLIKCLEQMLKNGDEGAQ